MNGNCALCGQTMRLPDGPPTEDAPQFIYAALAIDTPGIYRVLQYPVTHGESFGFRAWITGNIELVKQMQKVDSIPGDRNEFVCHNCLKERIGIKTNPFQHQTEQEFISGLEFDTDEDTGQEYAGWQHGEYDWIDVSTHAKGGYIYVISNGGDEEYIRTTNYDKFCEALDEIDAMSYDEYCAIFC